MQKDLLPEKNRSGKEDGGGKIYNIISHKMKSKPSPDAVISVLHPTIPSLGRRRNAPYPSCSACPTDLCLSSFSGPVILPFLRKEPK